MDNPHFFLYHLLQKYLVERDIYLISLFARCLLQMISWVTYLQEVRGSCPGWFILPPPPSPSTSPRISERIHNTQILLQEYLVERDINFISVSEMLTSNVQLGYLLKRGGGQAVQDGLSCSKPRISNRMDNQQFLLHHLLQKYLVERDINFISVNLRC